MRRFVAGLMSIAFVAALGTGTGFAADKMGGAMSGTTMSKCPKGQMWVNGHMDKKTGKMTKGYCRKKAAKTM